MSLGSGNYDYSAGILPGTTGQVDLGAPGAAGGTGAGLGTGTGKYGYQTVQGGGMSSNPFVAAWQWLNEPFKSPMPPVDIFLLVGVVLASVFLWGLILYHVRIAAEAI
jgi:hypothetical protein